jgi:orotate phosphoribosyltransferase
LTATARAGSGGTGALLEELRGILVERSIRYGDFTLASGAKSRYYCDTKLTVLTPRGALLIGEALAALLRPHGVEAAGGLAMGAAYLATAVAIASEQDGEPIYGFTVRAEQKDHGRGQKIDEAWHPDGKLLRPGRRVAVLDDVVTTAGSTLKALDALLETGCDVRVAAAVLDRRAGGAEAIRARGVPFFALFEADAEGRLSVAAPPARVS